MIVVMHGMQELNEISRQCGDRRMRCFTCTRFAGVEKPRSIKTTMEHNVAHTDVLSQSGRKVPGFFHRSVMVITNDKSIIRVFCGF